MSLQEAIAEARQYIDDPPPNESCTCEWVILPLLRAIGYAPRDIVSRLADNNGQFPDYTLLSQSNHFTWFLEAKAWNIALEDRHAQQSLNYANQNGKRWVVLTNGRMWRLYDNDIRGTASDKMVVQAQLGRDESAGIEDLLDILRIVSKENVLAGHIESQVTQLQQRHQAHTEAAERHERESRERRERETTARQTLDQTLPAQLQNQDSELIQQMCLILQRQDGLSGATSEILAQWFERRFTPPPAIPAPVLPARIQSSQTNATGGSSMTLQELAQISIDGKQIKPTLLTFPDNTHASVRSWVDMAQQTVTWIYGQGNRPQMPFAGYSPQRWFLNTSPHHPRNPMRGPKTIVVGNYGVYMDTDMTGKHFAERLVALCLATGIDPGNIKVVLS